MSEFQKLHLKFIMKERNLTTHTNILTAHGGFSPWSLRDIEKGSLLVHYIINIIKKKFYELELFEISIIKNFCFVILAYLVYLNFIYYECLVGVQKARRIAGKFRLPIVGVHHMEAHALVAR